MTVITWRNGKHFIESYPTQILYKMPIHQFTARILDNKQTNKQKKKKKKKEKRKKKTLNN